MSSSPAFFEPGKVYIQGKPFTAPEILGVFRCIAVAEHPAKHELRAFGFCANVYPGDNWVSWLMGPSEWADGWSEHVDATTPGGMAALRRSLDGSDPR
jgi:hypothetical protein